MLEDRSQKVQPQRRYRSPSTMDAVTYDHFSVTPSEHQLPGTFFTARVQHSAAQSPPIVHRSVNVLAVYHTYTPGKLT